MLKIGKKWYFKAKSTMSEKIDECTAHNDYADLDIEDINLCKKDIKCFKYRCLKKAEVEHLLNQTVSNLSNKLQITPSLSKLLLRCDGWTILDVITKYKNNSDNLLIENEIELPAIMTAATCSSNEETCSICSISLSKDNFDGLGCSHVFCDECWRFNIEMELNEGNSFIMCMENNSAVIALDDFILKYLTVDIKLKLRYHECLFQNFVECHPQLRFCPGPDCTVIIQSKCWEPRCPIECCECKTIFCFKCGMACYAPTDCETCNKWLSEAEMQYIIKGYPQFRCSVGKSNRCEIMKCSNCTFRFCWNYTTNTICTRNNKNKNVTEEEAQNRMSCLSLRRWYEKWDSHSKSLGLVQEAYKKLTLRIKRKTGHGCRSWIEWQDIYPVLKLITKCLNTLKYSYPKVFVMNAGLEKYLLQCRQKLLQKKLNKLTRKIEKAEVNDIAELQHQVMVCEEYRKSLLD